MDDVATADDGGWQTRIVGGRFGRLGIGLVVAVVAFWIVAPNLPSSAVRDDLSALWEPAADVGLVQDWAVFSPNPRSQSIDVRARLEYDDGSVTFWDLPEFDPAFGAWRQYRWHKWQERVRLDDEDAHWLPTARWIADRNRRDDVRPARVTLIRRWIDHEPLVAGSPTVDVGWNEFEFFEWQRDS